MSRKVVVFIIFLALTVRLLYVLCYPQIKVTSDAQHYSKSAINLVENKEFSEWKEDHSILRPPGYPLFLAAIYTVVGYSYTAVRVCHAVFGSLTVLLIYLICIGVSKNKTVPFLAAGLVGLHPVLIGYTGILYTETMFTFLLASFVYFFQTAILEKSYLKFSLSGFFLGLAALTSSRIMYFPFLLLVLWLVLPAKKRIMKQWSLLALTMLLTIAPWTIRNYIITGKFILLEDYHKAVIWFAANPYDVHDWEKPPIEQLIEGKSREEYQQAMYEEGKRYLREHPFIYLKNSVKRFFRLWSSGQSYIFSGLEKSALHAWQENDFKLLAVKCFFLAINFLLVISGFFGIFFMVKQRCSDFFAILSPIVYLTLLHSLSLAGPRLFVPILPFILIFSAITIEKFLSGNNLAKKLLCSKKP